MLDKPRSPDKCCGLQSHQARQLWQLRGPQSRLLGQQGHTPALQGLCNLSRQVSCRTVAVPPAVAFTSSVAH